MLFRSSRNGMCYNPAMSFETGNSRNIVLVGFMGAGKSVVAKELAKTLKKPAVSTDELIEKTEKATIAQIFEKKGEIYFRQLEREIVKKVAALDSVIIDCGGGVVLNPDNIRDLKNSATLIFIAATPGVIYERLKNQTNRPLLKGGDPQEKINELLALRQPLYKQAADYTVDGDRKTAAQVAQEIIQLIHL